MVTGKISAVALALAALATLILMFSMGNKQASQIDLNSIPNHASELTIDVDKSKIYSITIDYLVDSSDPKNYKQLRTLVEDLAKNGRYAESRASKTVISFSMYYFSSTEWKKLQDYQVDVDMLDLYSWGADSISKQILSISLEPGRYKIMVHSFEKNFQLNQVSMQLSMGVAYRGK